MGPFAEIFEENARWVAAKLQKDPKYFEKLARGPPAS
jgi:hypothetical protein